MPEEKCFFKEKKQENLQLDISPDDLYTEFAKLADEEVTPDNPLVLELARRYKERLKELREELKSETIELCGKSFYMDARLMYILNHFNKSVKKKWDFVMLITGLEGAAKSTLARAIAYYLTKKYNPKNEFTLDQIVFTQEEFSDALDNAKVGSVILWDEFVLGGYSEDMSALQTLLIKKFTLIRKKRLFIILVIPNIWMLRSYFAIARTKLLIDVYSPDFLRRGFFRLWGYKSKIELYFKGTMSGSKWQYLVPPDINGRFSPDIAQDDFFVNTKEYEAKKDAAIASIDDSALKKTKVDMARKNCRVCKAQYMTRDLDAQVFRCKDCGYTEEFPSESFVKKVLKKRGRTIKSSSL